VAMVSSAASCGLFASSYAVVGAVDSILPVDAYIPGCPPRPQAIIHGIMVALDRWEERSRQFSGPL
jgi:NADH:ubiquinone oxidoreductase subunit B-like Fe-S oxidoreductase